MHELTPIQKAAFETIARHILVGRYAKISTIKEQQGVFNELHRRDALAVSSAILARYGGMLGGGNIALPEVVERG